jgi:hypothetical protein
MGIKLLWTGLTITFLGWVIPQAAMVGSIIMVIGCVVMWINSK